MICGIFWLFCIIREWVFFAETDFICEHYVLENWQFIDNQGCGLVEFRRFFANLLFEGKRFFFLRRFFRM